MDFMKWRARRLAHLPHVYCASTSCGAYLGKTRYAEDVECWKCNVCATLTYVTKPA